MPKVESLISFVEKHPVLAKVAIGIAAFLAVAGPLLIMIVSICSIVSVLIPLVGTLSAVSLPITGTMLLIAAAIAAVVAAGVLLYKNWDTVKQKANQLKNHFKSLGEKLTKPFRDAWTKIKGIINKIKGLFPIKIGKLLKNIKLPHFSISWGQKDAGPLGTIKWPKGMSVKWYKQGGIFTKPTLLGGNSGVGEAGAEAALPLSELWKQMDKMNNNMIAAVVNGVAEAIGNSNATIVLQLDGKTLVETTAPLMQSKINELTARQNRRLGYV